MVRVVSEKKGFSLKVCFEWDRNEEEQKSESKESDGQVLLLYTRQVPELSSGAELVDEAGREEGERREARETHEDQVELIKGLLVSSSNDGNVLEVRKSLLIGVGSEEKGD